MTREEILEGIVEILKSVNTVDQALLSDVNENTDYINDLGVPSAELVNIIAKAEDKFDIEFEDDDVDLLGSRVKDIIDLIIEAKEK
ncbi:MAG: hypothetical protein JXQ96_02505 [Cyclobacteriaceae bacterium]